MNDGVALLFNATASVVTQVLVDGTPTATQPLPALTLFPVSQPNGTGVLSGCSFSLAPNQDHVLTVRFQSGQHCSASISTPSAASPCVCIVAFINGIVVTQPDGTATDVAFQRSTAAAGDGVTGAWP